LALLRYLLPENRLIALLAMPPVTLQATYEQRSHFEASLETS
jgi:hypothetical protein